MQGGHNVMKTWGEQHKGGIKLECPKCKKIIYHLINRQSVIAEIGVRASISQYGHGSWYRFVYDYCPPIEATEKQEVNDWICPICREVLFTDNFKVLVFFDKWWKLGNQGLRSSTASKLVNRIKYFKGVDL
jgi:hypothetical protein